MRISDWSSDVCSSDLEYHFVDVAGSRDAPERSRRFAALLSGIGADVLHVHGLAFAGDAFAVSRRLPRMPPILCQDHADRPPQIGRASCRERVCQDVLIQVVAVSLKKTNK